MSLSGWQTAIAVLVNDDSIATLDRIMQDPAIALTSSERQSLARCHTSPGLGVTATIRRSWRAASLRRTARLTIGALAESDRTVVLDDWIHRASGGSFYYGSDVESFLADLLTRVTCGPVNAVARFELAAHRSLSARTSSHPDHSFALLSAHRVLRRHPAADLIEFWAPSERILTCAGAGEPLPCMVEGRYPVLVAPGVPFLARPATAAEAVVWGELDNPRGLLGIDTVCAGAEEATSALLEAHALIPLASCGESS